MDSISLLTSFPDREDSQAWISCTCGSATSTSAPTRHTPSYSWGPLQLCYLLLRIVMGPFRSSSRRLDEKRACRCRKPKMRLHQLPLQYPVAPTAPPSQRSNNTRRRGHPRTRTQVTVKETKKPFTPCPTSSRESAAAGKDR